MLANSLVAVGDCWLKWVAAVASLEATGIGGGVACEGRSQLAKARPARTAAQSCEHVSCSIDEYVVKKTHHRATLLNISKARPTQSLQS